MPLAAPHRTRRPAPKGATATRRRRGAAGARTRHVDVILNARASGAADVAAVGRRATTALEAACAHVRIRRTADPAELAEAVSAADGRRIVLVGGDGTVHALANLAL